VLTGACAGHTDSNAMPDPCVGSCEIGAARCTEDRAQIETCARVGNACPTFNVSSSCIMSHVCGSVGSVHCGDPEWAQWSVPNGDSDVARGAPTPTSYTTMSDGTVLDNVTGLIWQQGSFSPDSPERALAACRAGGPGWRLPTLIELLSLVDYGRSGPSIDPVAFPDNPVAMFLTATSAASDDFHWVVDFSNGMSFPMTGASNFRCVR
jgi:hypothetical protein